MDDSGEQTVRCVRMIKEQYPDLQVIAGNVATAEATKALIEAEQMGQGWNRTRIHQRRWTGGRCRNRCATGKRCDGSHEMAKEYSIPIYAIGGTGGSGRYDRGDCCRANVCMMGSIFAGCDESPGTFELFQGRKYKVYRGMGSIAAMENGSKDRYFQSDAKKLVRRRKYGPYIKVLWKTQHFS